MDGLLFISDIYGDRRSDHGFIIPNYNTLSLGLGKQDCVGIGLEVVSRSVAIRYYITVDHFPSLGYSLCMYYITALNYHQSIIFRESKLLCIKFILFWLKLSYMLSVILTVFIVFTDSFIIFCDCDNKVTYLLTK